MDKHWWFVVLLPVLVGLFFAFDLGQDLNLASIKHRKAELARQPEAAWDLHLMTPYRCQIYSGMLPGWIAGHYPIEACAIKLDDLALSAAVAFHQTSGLGLDLAQSALRCADGSQFIALGAAGLLDPIAGHSDEGMPLQQCLICGPTRVVR